MNHNFEHAAPTPTLTSPIYHQLNSEDQEIRLLEIFSTLNNGRIECRLSTGHLKTANYVVLSYRWGTLAAQHEIIMNGRPFYVRKNLWDFLHIIQHQPGMFLWIDALCINQSDTEERNQQVRIMGQIFQSAAMVLSWLGAANAEVELAFDLMSSVWSLPASEDESDHLPSLHTDQSEDKSWQCIAELCNFPYWNRVWVVQEILLSSNNYLLCGQKTLPWQVFANFVSLIDVRFACPPQYARAIHSSTAMSYAMSKPYVMVPQNLQWRIGNALKHDFGKAWDRREHNLFRILTMFGDRDCTDPLDHVYALLSLTEEGETFPIQYGIDRSHLFLVLVHFCGQLAIQEQELRPSLVLRQNSQRAFIRNTKCLAEMLELVVYAQKTQPYYYGSGADSRSPSPKPDPCFPRLNQVLVLQCTMIIPGNEPPILRSNTLKRSISAIQFDQLLHIDESGSWLMCRWPSSNVHNVVVTGVITIKDGPQGRGFRILDPGRLAIGSLMPSLDDREWSLSITSEGHLDFLKIVVLGQQPD